MNRFWVIIITVSRVSVGITYTKLVISGSIRLVSEAIYVVLQIPVMLIYLSFLKLQLP